MAQYSTPDYSLAVPRPQPTLADLLQQRDQSVLTQQSIQRGGIENEQAQIQLNDSKAMTQAMHDWDGKSYDSLIPLVVKHGGSANAVMGLKAKALEFQSKYSQIAKDDAETGKNNLEAQMKKNDMVSGALKNLSNVDDAQLPGAIASTAQQLRQQGLIDDAHLQEAMQLSQSGGTAEQIRKALDIYRKGYMADSQQMQEAKDQAELAAKGAQLPGQKAESQIKQAEAGMLQQGGMTQPMADSRYRFVQQKLAAKQPISPDDQNFIKAYEKQKLLVPQTTANIRMEGMGKIRQFPVYDNVTKQTVYMDSNEINDAKLREPGRFTVPNYSPEAEIQKQTGKAFAPGGKAGEELQAFNTALAHADLLQKAADELQNGEWRSKNSVFNKFKTEFGAAGPPNYQTIANAYTREVTKALSAGHLTDAEIKEQGATMPSNASPEQIKGVIQSYKDLMASKVNIRKQQFESGKSGQPNFGAPMQQHTAGNKASLPEGSTGTGSDGQRYIVKGGVWVKK